MQAILDKVCDTFNFQFTEVHPLLQFIQKNCPPYVASNVLIQMIDKSKIEEILNTTPENPNDITEYEGSPLPLNEIANLNFDDSVGEVVVTPSGVDVSNLGTVPRRVYFNEFIPSLMSRGGPTKPVKSVLFKVEKEQIICGVCKGYDDKVFIVNCRLNLPFNKKRQMVPTEQYGRVFLPAVPNVRVSCRALFDLSSGVVFDAQWADSSLSILSMPNSFVMGTLIAHSLDVTHSQRKHPLSYIFDQVASLEEISRCAHAGNSTWSTEKLPPTKEETGSDETLVNKENKEVHLEAIVAATRQYLVKDLPTSRLAIPVSGIQYQSLDSTATVIHASLTLRPVEDDLLDVIQQRHKDVLETLWPLLKEVGNAAQFRECMMKVLSTISSSEDPVSLSPLNPLADILRPMLMSKNKRMYFDCSLTMLVDIGHFSITNDCLEVIRKCVPLVKVDESEVFAWCQYDPDDVSLNKLYRLLKITDLARLLSRTVTSELAAFHIKNLLQTAQSKDISATQHFTDVKVQDLQLPLNEYCIQSWILQLQSLVPRIHSKFIIYERMNRSHVLANEYLIHEASFVEFNY